jgi:UDP-N-acetylmuramate dehydrogenase
MDCSRSSGRADMVGDVAAIAESLAGPGTSVSFAAGLAQHTTLRVGGPAALLVTVDDEPALVRTVGAVVRSGAPLLVIGRGSNLLVGDEGWPGVVLRLGGGFRGILIDGTTVVTGAAEPMPSVATRTAQAGLTGFAWGAAVPGSMGGGVRMNAGAHGADMSDSLVSARVLDVITGELTDWHRERLALGYRTSALRDTSIVTSVTLALSPADPAEVLAEIDAIRAWRREHQPLNRPSCGSVFANPAGRSAGALIEDAGLKGVRVGGAQVSTTHANFIVTEPGARAADVEALIDLITQRVRGTSGVTLRTEVVRPGQAPSRFAG